MLSRPLAAACALLVTLGAAASAQTAQYPDWKGQWVRKSAGTFDPDKPFGLGQQAPLTPEYQKVLEDSIADQASGGQGNNFDRARCMPTGMPHMMTFGPLEFVVTPETTYILIRTQVRRIFTDGREWPKEIEPSYAGY